MDTTLAPLQHFRQRSPGQPSTAKNAHACVTAALSSAARSLLSAAADIQRLVRRSAEGGGEETSALAAQIAARVRGGDALLAEARALAAALGECGAPRAATRTLDLAEPAWADTLDSAGKAAKYLLRGTAASPAPTPALDAARRAVATAGRALALASPPATRPPRPSEAENENAAPVTPPTAKAGGAQGGEASFHTPAVMEPLPSPAVAFHTPAGGTPPVSALVAAMAGLGRNNGDEPPSPSPRRPSSGGGGGGGGSAARPPRRPPSGLGPGRQAGVDAAAAPRPPPPLAARLAPPPPLAGRAPWSPVCGAAAPPPRARAPTPTGDVPEMDAAGAMTAAAAAPAPSPPPRAVPSPSTASYRGDARRLVTLHALHRSTPPMPHGLGVAVLACGGTVSGDWACGAAAGHGCYSSRHGHAAYAGAWAAGFRSGLGVESLPGVGTYAGAWAHGLRSGVGVFRAARGGGSHEGAWAAGVPAGSGIVTGGGDEGAPAASYAGVFSTAGLFDGPGLYTWPDGSTFAGGFRGGLPDGLGVLTCGQTGATHAGGWAAGARSGWGLATETFRAWAGEWVDGEAARVLPCPAAASQRPGSGVRPPPQAVAAAAAARDAAAAAMRASAALRDPAGVFQAALAAAVRGAHVAAERGRAARDAAVGRAGEIKKQQQG
jgi:hypothetical protein